jgi:hypothetical protein
MKARAQSSVVATKRSDLRLPEDCSHLLSTVYARLQVGMSASSSGVKFWAHKRKTNIRENKHNINPMPRSRGIEIVVAKGKLECES